MASGLSAVSSLLTFDFLLKVRPGLPEERRVFFGRAIMAAVLVTCVACAPLIGRYHGLYAYLVKVWSLLAPPVFVCVVAGVFTRRATNAGAVATLATGAVLGLAAFVALDHPSWMARLPAYLRSSLNLCFVLTLVCAGVMALVSLRSEPPQDAAGRAPGRAATATMTDGERRTYRWTLAVFAILWLAVLLTFSPWGIGRT
jgi:SSS family solute:Na+ symporter